MAAKILKENKILINLFTIRCKVMLFWRHRYSWANNSTFADTGKTKVIQLPAYTTILEFL